MKNHDLVSQLSRYRAILDDVIREIEEKGDYEWARNIKADIWWGPSSE